MSAESIRIAICDDLKEEREKLKAYINEYLDINELVAEIDEFECGEDFLNSDTKKYSLVVLDIFMGELNGMETARELIKKNKSIQIIFYSTSYEYAAESYDVSALYYLVKPAKKEKAFEVLDKFFGAYMSLKTITVKIGRAEEDVYISEIISVESNNHKCIIHTKDEDLEVSMSLSKLEEMLLPYDFIKPLRYALVSLKEITAIPTDVVTLSDGTVYSVSRKEREAVKQAFNDYKWKMMFGKGRGN